MKSLIPLLLGHGLRLELELVRHPTVAVQINGVSFDVPKQVAQAIAQERKEHAEALAARPAVSPELAEAVRREQLAFARAAAAEARVKALETELAEERGPRREALFAEAIRTGVEASRADVELVSEACTWRGPWGHA